MNYIVVIGNPFDGMRCYGPMNRNDAEELEADILTDYDESYCYLVTLQDPKSLP